VQEWQLGCSCRIKRGERLNQQTADELIERAVKKAIKDYSKEQKSERKRKALHNTKLLLKNYEKIKSSVEEAISEANQLESQSYSDEDDVYIASIRRSKLKSLIVIAHIDRALELAKEEYEQKEMLYKYTAFYECLMNNVTCEKEAEELETSTVTIRRWITEVTKEISIRIFGVDGLEMA
jgi:hypothetical protein